MSELKQAPTWKIWANPIFRRYCRSRLRLRGLGVWLMITLIVAAFIFFMSRSAAMYRFAQSPVDAARVPLIPLLVWQGIILFLLGAGQVAGAMTAEADEGVLDYQRVAPMTPLAKVLGYLFGLPVREWVVCLSTMPFTVWSVIVGEVPFKAAGMLYLVFFTAAVMYHLTGLVAGTVVKNRRWAFLVSIGVIFLLYTVMPQVAKFGLPYFRYLTIMPVFEEVQAFLIPRDLGAGLLTLNNLLPKATFFDLKLPEAMFTVTTQLFLIATGIMMLWRRWRRAESHLLGKGWALGLFVWLQVLLLGNALPLIESGKIFISQAFNAMAFRYTLDWSPQSGEAVAMIGIFGMVTLVILWVLTLMITPNHECQLRGWRRAHKLGKRSLSVASDPATATGWVFLMAVAGIAGWWIFANEVIESRWFPGQEVPHVALLGMSLAYLTGAMGFQVLLEWRGGRTVGLCAILIGVVPVMLGAILASVDDRYSGVSMWLVCLSPLLAPFCGSEASLPMGDMPFQVSRALVPAFWFWQGIAVLLLGVFLTKLWKARREIRHSKAVLSKGES